MATADGEQPKPSVLIIGGLGYMGRFLAKYIHTHQLASRVRLVDKILPQLARLAPEFEEPCSPSIFMQADACHETSLARIFDHPDGHDKTWDYVFNLGGESSWSQPMEIYRLRSLQLSLNLGKEAAKRGVKAFVEISNGIVYAAERKPRQEWDKLKPWLNIGKSKVEAEETLSKMPGLNLVILRVAHVYGEYVSGIVAKPLCLGRVYLELDKKLEWLWSADLKMNTVHVEDCVRALWVAAEWRSQNNTIDDPTCVPRPTSGKHEIGPIPGTPVFNIVDHGETSQGTLAGLAGEYFSIKTGFHGTIISTFAKLHMDYVVDDLNELHLGPWADMLERYKITRPGPLSPFLEKELLKDRDLSMDGSLFERTTGFKYEYPRLTGGLIWEMIDSFERMHWWPPVPKDKVPS